MYTLYSAQAVSTSWVTGAASAMTIIVEYSSPNINRRVPARILPFQPQIIKIQSKYRNLFKNKTYDGMRRTFVCTTLRRCFRAMTQIKTAVSEKN